MRGPHDGANIDCDAEYRWENNSSPREKRRQRAGERKRRRWSVARRRGDRDSTRPVSGLRVRLVKSFAGIMNPPRVVIPTFRPDDVTEQQSFCRSDENKGRRCIAKSERSLLREAHRLGRQSSSELMSDLNGISLQRTRATVARDREQLKVSERTNVAN